MMNILNFQSKPLEDIKKFRKKYIEEKYNQADLLDYMFTHPDDIDFIIDISNRGDGKTFSYYELLIMVSEKHNLKPIIIAKHDEVIQDLVDTTNIILSECSAFNEKDYYFKRYSHYTLLINTKTQKNVLAITDLNKASDLKNISAFIKDFPIIVLEEFMSQSHLTRNENKKLALIYSTIDRKGEIPFIKSPKIVMLGNPEGLTSEILSSLELYEPMLSLKMGESHIVNNAIFKLHVNEKVNEEKNTRVLDKLGFSELTKGNFNFNSSFITRKTDIVLPKEYYTLSTVENTYRIYMLPKKKIYITTSKKEETIDFTTRADNYSDNYLVTSSDYFSMDLYRLKLIEFSDAYTKESFNKDSEINLLNLYKLDMIKKTKKVNDKLTKSENRLREVNDEYYNKRLSDKINQSSYGMFE